MRLPDTSLALLLVSVTVSVGERFGESRVFGDLRISGYDVSVSVSTDYAVAVEVDIATDDEVTASVE